MKKIKNFYPLIVGVVLLVSVAAYGTRAYFSDSTEEQANIKLTLGNVEVTSLSEPWVYTPLNTSNNNQLNVEGMENISSENPTLKQTAKVTNVRPGDSFKKIFTFTNTGSLDAKVELKQTIINKDLSNEYEPYEVSLRLKTAPDGYKDYEDENIMSNVPINDAIILSGEEQAEIELIVSIPENIKNEYNRQDNPEDNEDVMENDVVLDLMTKAIKVTLIQADANSVD